MDFLIGFLFVVVVLCALMLIGIILIQQSKAGGGLSVLGGGATESVFGATAGNVVTRTTVVLASVFIGCTFILAILVANRAAPETLADRYEGGTSSPLQQAVDDALGLGDEEGASSEAESDIGSGATVEEDSAAATEESGTSE